jgi:hypothetical protein
MASLDMSMSKTVLNKSHNKLHALCAVIVFNMFLYPTQTDNCKVPQLSSAFQTQIQPQQPWLNLPHNEGHLLADGKKEADMKHEVFNYTLDGVSIHPFTTKILRPS